MLFVVSAFLTITGLFFCYIAVNLARSVERRRGIDDCDRRIQIIRRQGQ